jgi:hypothetical protein
MLLYGLPPTAENPNSKITVAEFHRPQIVCNGPQYVGAQFAGVDAPNPTAILAHEIDTSQVWFETEDWQRGEAEADADIAAGRVTRFDSEQAFFDSL